MQMNHKLGLAILAGTAVTAILIENNVRFSIIFPVMVLLIGLPALRAMFLR
jgi:hypothetical protein